MLKRMQKAEGRRQNHPDADCGMQNGENRGAGIRDKRLGCRALRKPRWYREIRQLLESEGEVTARPLPQPLSIEWRGWPQAGRGPTGRARLLLSPIQSSAAVSLGQPPRI